MLSFLGDSLLINKYIMAEHQAEFPESEITQVQADAKYVANAIYGQRFLGQNIDMGSLLGSLPQKKDNVFDEDTTRRLKEAVVEALKHETLMSLDSFNPAIPDNNGIDTQAAFANTVSATAVEIYKGGAASMPMRIPVEL